MITILTQKHVRSTDENGSNLLRGADALRRIVFGAVHQLGGAVTVFPQGFDLVTGKVPDYTKSEMKAKMFEVVLHMLPSGKSPVTALEEQINDFLVKHPDLKLVATHMSTLVAPAEPNALPRREEASIIVFCTLFYND